MEKVALFIDGANISNTCKLLNFEVDYAKLLAYFEARYRIIRSYYYTALIEENGNIQRQPMVDWLSYHRFTVRTKKAKVYTNDDTGERRVKGNMDMELAVDMVKTASLVDRIILFTGDGDFSCLVEYLQSTHAVQVTVVSTIQSRPPMISDELRKQCDEYLDINNIRGEVCKDYNPRRAVSQTRVSLVSRMRSA